MLLWSIILLSDSHPLSATAPALPGENGSHEAHQGGQAVQEGGKRDGIDLETPPGGRVHVSPAQGGRVTACRVRGRAICRWRTADSEDTTADGGLTPTAKAS